MLAGKAKTLWLMTVVAAVAIAGCAAAATQRQAPTAPPAPTETAQPSATEPPAATETPAPTPILLTDGLDREVSLPEPAQRVLSLAPSNTEILFAVGAGSQVVGREEFSDYPAEALEVASVGSVYGELNTEAMVELEPDLVLMSELNNPEHVDVLEGLGLRVYYLPNPLSFEELYENMLTVGVLTGHLEEAEALVDSLRARVDSVVAAVEGAEPVRVYYEVDGTDSSAPWTTGSGTFQQVLIGMSEGVNIASDIEGWGTITLEELVNRDPEVMIFAAGPFVPTTVESVAERPGWGEISAVSEGRIYAIDTNWVDRPGPRLVDALEAMGAAIHPDRFEGP